MWQVEAIHSVVHSSAADCRLVKLNAVFCLIHSVCTLPCWATDEFFDFIDCHQALATGIFDNDSLCEQQLFIHKTPRMSKRFSQQNTDVGCKTLDHSSVYTATDFKDCDGHGVTWPRRSTHYDIVRSQ